MCGRGKFVFKNGDQYAGRFLNNRMHGHGTYSWIRGSKFEGSFERSKICGQGKMEYAFGHIYEGSWKDNLWHGRGVLTQRDGTVVKANWEFGSRVSGTVEFNPETIPETYVGHFDERDLRTGQGDYTYTDGSRYLGMWSRGRRHGKGIFFDRHGRKVYEGDWVRNVRDFKKQQKTVRAREYFCAMTSPPSLSRFTHSRSILSRNKTHSKRLK